MGYVLPQQPRSIVEVFKDSFLLCRTSFLPVLPFVLVCTFFLVASGMTGQHLNVVTPETPWKFFIITLILQIIGLFFLLCVVDGMHRVMLGEERRYNQTMMIALKRLIPCLVVTVATFALTVAGLLLLIIPGIILYILFSFSLFEVLLSGKGMIESVKESVILVWPRWWQTFFVIVPMLGALFGVIEIIRAVLGINPFSIVVPPVTMHSMSILSVGGVLYFLGTYWMISVLLSQYHNLKCAQRLKQTFSSTES